MLPHRNGSGEHVARVLAHLVDHPDDRSAFLDLSPYLASEDTAWPAAYAAVPHLLDIAAKASSAEGRWDYLYRIGYIEMCDPARNSVPESVAEVVQAAYRCCLGTALKMLLQTLAELEDNTNLHYSLAALAALEGNRSLALVINHLHMGCPHCGEDLLDL